VPEGGLGLFASVEDLLRFGRFHVGSLPGGGGPFDATWRRRMHAATEAPFHDGWWRPGVAWISNGNVRGANANLTLLPQERLVVAVLVNRGSSAADELAFGIVDALVPGFAARAQENRAAYQRRYRAPYRADPQWSGAWTGEVVAGERTIPLRLVLGAETVTLTLAGEPPHELAGASLNELGELRGRCTTTVDVAGSGGGDLRLLLVRDGDRMTGYVTARIPRAAGVAEVPFAVRAARAP